MTGHLQKEIFLLGKRPGWEQLRGFKLEVRKTIREARFRWAVPAENAGSMANVLNAAWDVERDHSFWDKHPSLGADRADLRDPQTQLKIKDRRREALYDLILKNIEVLEYEHIVSRPLVDA